MTSQPISPHPFDAYLGSDPFIFVSYAHKDKALVYRIITKMHQEGMRIWYDEGIPPSEKWMKTIAEKILACTVFLVFLSPNAVASENVLDEIVLAKECQRDKNFQFFIIYLAPTTLPNELRLAIVRIQALMLYQISEADLFRKLYQIFNPVVSMNHDLLIDAKSMDSELSKAQQINLISDGESKRNETFPINNVSRILMEIVSLLKSDRNPLTIKNQVEKFNLTQVELIEIFRNIFQDINLCSFPLIEKIRYIFPREYELLTENPSNINILASIILDCSIENWQPSNPNYKNILETFRKDHIWDSSQEDLIYYIELMLGISHDSAKSLLLTQMEGKFQQFQYYNAQWQIKTKSWTELQSVIVQKLEQEELRRKTELEAKIKAEEQVRSKAQDEMNQLLKKANDLIISSDLENVPMLLDEIFKIQLKFHFDSTLLNKTRELLSQRQDSKKNESHLDALWKEAMQKSKNEEWKLAIQLWSDIITFCEKNSWLDRKKQAQHQLFEFQNKKIEQDTLYLRLPCIFCGSEIPEIINGSTIRCFVCNTQNSFTESKALIDQFSKRFFGELLSMEFKNPSQMAEIRITREKKFTEILFNLEKECNEILNNSPVISTPLIKYSITSDQVLDIAKKYNIIAILLKNYLLPLGTTIEESLTREQMYYISLCYAMMFIGSYYTIKASSSNNNDSALNNYTTASVFFKKITALVNQTDTKGLEGIFNIFKQLGEAYFSYSSGLSIISKGKIEWASQELNKTMMILKEIRKAKLLPQVESDLTQLQFILALQPSVESIFKEMKEQNFLTDTLSVRSLPIESITEILKNLEISRSKLKKINDQFAGVVEAFRKLNFGIELEYIQRYVKTFQELVVKNQEDFDRCLESTIRNLNNDFLFRCREVYRRMELIAEAARLPGETTKEEIIEQRKELIMLETTIEPSISKIMALVFGKISIEDLMQKINPYLKESHGKFDEFVKNAILTIIDDVNKSTNDIIKALQYIVAQREYNDQQIFDAKRDIETLRFDIKEFTILSFNLRNEELNNLYNKTQSNLRTDFDNFVLNVINKMLDTFINEYRTYPQHITKSIKRRFFTKSMVNARLKLFVKKRFEIETKYSSLFNFTFNALNREKVLMNFNKLCNEIILFLNRIIDDKNDLNSSEYDEYCKIIDSIDELTKEAENAMEKGDYEKARNLYMQASNISKDIAEYDRSTMFLSNSQEILKIIEEKKAEMHHKEKTLQFQKEQKTKIAEAEIMLKEGKFDEATSLYQSIVEICAELNDYENERKYRQVSNDLISNKSKYKKSWEKDKPIRLAEAELARILTQIDDIGQQEGNEEKISELYVKAAKFALQLSKKEMANKLINQSKEILEIKDKKDRLNEDTKNKRELEQKKIRFEEQRDQAVITAENLMENGEFIEAAKNYALAGDACEGLNDKERAREFKATSKKIMELLDDLNKEYNEKQQNKQNIITAWERGLGLKCSSCGRALNKKTVQLEKKFLEVVCPGCGHIERLKRYKGWGQEGHK